MRYCDIEWIIALWCNICSLVTCPVRDDCLGSGWDIFSLSYHVESPVSAIVTKEVMRPFRYNRQYLLPRLLDGSPLMSLRCQLA